MAPEVKGKKNYGLKVNCDENIGWHLVHRNYLFRVSFWWATLWLQQCLKILQRNWEIILEASDKTKQCDFDWGSSWFCEQSIESQYSWKNDMEGNVGASSNQNQIIVVSSSKICSKTITNSSICWLRVGEINSKTNWIFYTSFQRIVIKRKERRNLGKESRSEAKDRYKAKDSIIKVGSKKVIRIND